MSPDSCVLHVSLVLYYAKEFFWGIAFLKAKICWISPGLHRRSYFGGVQLTVENWGYQIQTWRVVVSASRQHIELQLSGMSLIIMQLFWVELIYHTSCHYFSMFMPNQLDAWHTRGQVFLCSLAFIKRRLKIHKVKSTANASKKIKTNHHEAFCTTHRHLSHP